MAVLPITLLLLSVCCLGLRADQAACNTTVSEERLSKFELLLKQGMQEVKDGQRFMTTQCQNDLDAPIKVYKDCQAVYDAGHRTSGVYSLKLNSGILVNAFCDQDTEGGGWTVIQRRTDGSEAFYRGWFDYKNGFGNVYNEYWIGNDNIHALTAKQDQKLNVELQYQNENGYANYTANYNEFWTEDETSNYKLTVTGYNGTARDALSDHNGFPFSTMDRDNDDTTVKNCAQAYHGAWWYYNCLHSNLNGPYRTRLWGALPDKYITGTKMMVKPR